MRIKLFLTQLKNAMEKTFPILTVNFFVSRRNRYVHMGLNRPLHSIENFMEMLQFIENLWNEKKKWQRTFYFLQISWNSAFSKMEVWLFTFQKKKKKLDFVAIPFKRISSNAKVLLKAFPTSAGYDFFAAERKTIVSLGRVLIKTNLCLEIPKDYYGRVVGKSGLANFQGIFAFNGTVDAEYRGNVCVVLFSLGNFSYVVEVGNPIGQFIVEKRNDIKFVEYNSLPDSDCSNNGFGSTLGF